MNVRCQDLRDRIASLDEGALRLSEALRDHLADCADCATWLSRRSPAVAAGFALEPLRAPAELERRVAAALTREARARRAIEALRALPRLETPAELEGRVVASLHPGHREDRAVAWLRDGLEPLAVPAELEQRLAARLASRDVASRGPVRRAPTELAARLDADLGDLEGAISRRFASRLTPVPAPDALRARVHSTMAGVVRARRWTLSTVGLIAASVLAILTWRSLAPERDPAGSAALQHLAQLDLGFDVVLVAPASIELSPITRALVDGVTGGLRQTIAALADAPVQTAPRSDAPSSRRPAQDPAAERIDRGAESYPASGGPIPDPTLGDSRARDFLEKVEDAPFSVAHSGDRRLEIRDPRSGAVLALRERVSADGAGRFTVRLLDGGPGDELFASLHHGREGFIQRYRDFRVRDLASFMASFEVQVLDADTKVAGRDVVLLDVVRCEEPASRYRVGIDPETGLVLSYEERFGPKQELVASFVFETLDLDPDLTEFELTGGPSQWVEFDLDDVPREIAAGLLHPAYTPRHHELQRAATRADAHGRTWVEFVYGDGVEQVFFLHAHVQAGDPELGPMGLARGDSVRAAQVGAWSILEGEIDSVPVAAVGKVDIEELLLLVQSAFTD